MVNPKTAATFRVLEFFELLQYELKLLTYEFYQTISRLTDNTGIHVPKDRYPTLLRIVHQWRHLKLLKHTGRGHDPVRGASETQPGECALLCPPCPHPGINLPEGWENAAKGLKFLYALNIALDACFRMKRKDCSSEVADPGLSKGFAYIVEESAFQEYLKKHDNETEPKSTCSRHDAVNLADMRPGQGYASTGIATVECSRHNFKRPQAVCDMQRGERYCNMDYITILSIQAFLQLFFISYDIACQWFIHLLMQLAQIDPTCPLLRPEKMVTATSDVAEHVIAHQELESTISPEKLQTWTEAMLAWELDPSSPNPYEIAVKTPTQAAVRRQLAAEEEQALTVGVDVALSDEVSPSSLIARGIDLKGEQYVHLLQ
ncbi:hypothetical protein H1R20_g1573, partial [Candolleomyces eurysporus]